MAAPARFLFDNDFAAPPAMAEPATPPVPTIELPVHEALVAEAEIRAFDRGVVAGREAAEAKAAQRLAEEAGRLASAAQSILAVLDTERVRIEVEAMRLAEILARKLAGHLLDTFPREAVHAVVSDAMASIRKAPHLVVRLAAEDAEPIRGELARIAAERGFEGRLVVLGEDGVSRGDCRVEWADGGIVFDRAATEAAVHAAIETHLVAITGESTKPEVKEEA